MATETLTIGSMAKKKNKPQGRSPAYTVFARVPPALGEAFEAYIKSIKPKPSATATLQMFIEEALEARGFWPIQPDEQEDGE